MASDDGQNNGAIGAAHDISVSEEDKDDLKLLRDAVRTLPPQPIKDLLSNGVCETCIFRLFGLHKQTYSHPSTSTPILRAVLYELIEGEGDGANSSSMSSISAPVQDVKEEITVCCVCLGILQFVYSVDNGVSVKKDCASNFAASIQDVVRKEGHEIDGFSLEVSITQIVAENEQAVWL